MRKTLLLLLLSFLVISPHNYTQTWRKVTAGSFPLLNKVIFVDENTGLCAGISGTIIISTDAGKTWEKQITNTQDNLEDLFFLNKSKGFAVGSNRLYLVTNDGGKYWKVDSLYAVPDKKATIKRIFFADDNVGWAIATTSVKGWILHTNDGGENWNLDFTTSVPLLDISAYGNKNVVVTSKNVHNIFYTKDGTTWNKSAEPADWPGDQVYSRSDVRAVFMTDENNVNCTGWGSVIQTQPTLYLRSTDGGVTWTYMKQESANQTFDNLFDSYFKDSMNGIAVGGGTSKGSIMTATSDGGKNWSPIIVPFGSTIYSIYGSGNKLWVCGEGGLIASSSDFGTTWILLTPIPNHSLYSIEFPTSQIGFAGGFNGNFLKTTNGGSTWTGSYLFNGASVVNTTELFFLNDKIGYSSHSYRIVSKTTDGGNSWNILIPDTNKSQVKSNGICFINEKLGFIVGKSDVDMDTIYKTIDGGKTWETKGSLVRSELNAVSFFDELNGVIVGNNLKILYTSDSGVNWSESILNNIPDDSYSADIKSVAYVQKDLVYACGEYLLLRSTDGGRNWNFIQTEFKTTLYGICFYDSSTGYAVGENYIMNTTDSGYSWQNIIDTAVVKGILYDVDTDDEGNVWICGANGNIFTNKDESSAVQQDVHTPEFLLFQNYPNPFNPSTTINFRIPEAGYIQLKVYDILGREVETLLDGFQESGIFNIHFEANDLSSGTYFYSLKYNNRILSGKMSLIK